MPGIPYTSGIFPTMASDHPGRTGQYRKGGVASLPGHNADSTVRLL